MSRIEQAWCRSLPWRIFTRRVVFPWSIGETDLHGEVLELGSGSGAMAAQLLDRYPRIRLTATDVDPAMRAAAKCRCWTFSSRAGSRRPSSVDSTSTTLPWWGLARRVNKP